MFLDCETHCTTCTAGEGGGGGGGGDTQADLCLMVRNKTAVANKECVLAILKQF